MIVVKVRRHIAKTISYRILSTSIGFAAVYGVSGSIKVGTLFSLGELLFKPILYFIHERVWYKYIRYGLKSE